MDSNEGKPQDILDLTIGSLELYLLLQVNTHRMERVAVHWRVVVGIWAPLGRGNLGG